MDNYLFRLFVHATMGQRVNLFSYFLQNGGGKEFKDQGLLWKVLIVSMFVEKTQGALG